MNPWRASASGFCYNDFYPRYGELTGGYGDPTGGYGDPTGGYGEPTGGYGDPTGGYSEPTGGYGEATGGYGYSSSGYEAVQGRAASSSSWIGRVAVVQPGAAQPPPPLYHPGYDSQSLLPLFQAPLGAGAAAVGPFTDIRQMSVSAGALWSEPARELTRKRVHEEPQLVAPPASKKPPDRTVEIAGFTWALPPDPGEKGPYPSLTFLVGAAISSSKSGMMKLSDIINWIKARYPSKLASSYTSVSCILNRRIDFTVTNTGKHGRTGEWRLYNPQQFRSCYEKSIFLKHRPCVSLIKVQRKALLADTHTTPLKVEIGGRIVTLPPYNAGQEKLPLRLLCGCAIATGPEHGSGVREIAEWIAGYYSIQEERAMERLKRNIRRTLNIYCSDFRRMNVDVPGEPKDVLFKMRWGLENPVAFAINHDGYVCSQDS